MNKPVPLLVLALSILPGYASAQDVLSQDSRFCLHVPDGWIAKNTFRQSDVVLAVLEPVHQDPKEFRENVVVSVHPKSAGIDIASVTKVNDAQEKSIRPDYAVSDEASVTICGFTGITRVCTMTFPEFVSSDREYLIDIGDSIVQLSCAIPQSRFKHDDQMLRLLCESMTISKK